MNFKINDRVRVDSSAGKFDGTVVEPRIANNEVVYVLLDSGLKWFFEPKDLTHIEPGISKGDYVLFYKEFDTRKALDGSVIHGSFIKEHIGEMGMVAISHKDGLCLVVSDEWSYWIPNECLIKVKIPREPEVEPEPPSQPMGETSTKVVEDNGTTFIDNGKVSLFESGAVRSLNYGKPRFDLISDYAELWLAEELSRNIGEYGAGNYLLGIPEFKCIESLKRHLNTVSTGLKTGNQKMIDEAVNILCNAMFLAHTIQLKKRGLYKVSDYFKSVLDGQKGKSPAA